MSRGAGCCNPGSRHVITVKSTLIVYIYFAPVLEELYPFWPSEALSHLHEQLSEVKSKSMYHAQLKLESSTYEVKGFAQRYLVRTEIELRLVYYGWFFSNNQGSHFVLLSPKQKLGNVHSFSLPEAILPVWTQDSTGLTLKAPYSWWVIESWGEFAPRQKLSRDAIFICPRTTSLQPRCQTTAGMWNAQVPIKGLLLSKSGWW